MKPVRFAAVFAAAFALLLFVFCSFADDIYTEGDFKYTVADESVTIVAYTGKDTVVTVPNAIMGYPVNEIGTGVFANNSVKAVYLPDTIMETKTGAFGEGVAVVFSNAGTTFESSHAWDDGTITKQPTCTEEGTATFTCILCGATKEDTVPETEHRFGAGVVTYVPTCADEGVVEYACTVCGERELEIIGLLNVHSYDNDCDTVCNICGFTREAKHTPGEMYYADGNVHYAYCTVCGARTNEEPHKTAKDASGNSFCTVCGYVTETVQGHVHTIVQVDAKDPGCTDPGNRAYYKCTGCNALFDDAQGNDQITADSVIIPAAGHKTAVRKGTEPTLTEGGKTDEIYCEVCGKVIRTSEDILPYGELEFSEDTTENADISSEDIGTVSDNTDAAKDDAPKDKRITSGAVIATALVVGIIAIVTVIWINLEKKRKGGGKQ